MRKGIDIVRAAGLMALAVLGAGCAGQARTASPVPSTPPVAVDIEWSALGIPHIQAADDYSLGYGIGYAYAQDNACLLADEILTARGERAALFGADGESSAQLPNLASDVFHTWLNAPAKVEAFRDAQPQPLRERLTGYAAGFNRYLGDAEREHGAAPSCRGSAWLRPIDELDLLRLTRRLLVEGGLGQFVEALAAAAPPDEQRTGLAPAQGLAAFHGFAAHRGSNALAVGAERSVNGKGLLLANPHFPWSGAQRFYQMHLSMPGRLDVMGAALPGLPVVNIGFNRHLAWTHTVDRASHFTLHRLQLDPLDPTRYVVDGRSHALHAQPVTIRVRRPDGRVVAQTHTVHESRFGPVVRIAELLDWDREHAYALQDANLDNTRVLAQWQAINAAPTLEALRRSVTTVQGIPWVNTLAVDDRGQALYLGVSVVPNVPSERLPECVDARLVEFGLPALDGSRSDCDWQADAAAAQPGIAAADALPQLLRRDFVHNANDSAWMTHPAAPLTGYSPLVSRDGEPLGLRARFALSRLQAHGDAPIDMAFLKSLVDGNRVHLADLTIDDLIAFCAQLDADDGARPACAALADWDRSAGVDAGTGYRVFEHVGMTLLEADDAWRVPFDAEDPIATPRGLDWQRPEVAEALRGLLEQAAVQLEVPARWGEIQGTSRGEDFIAIAGGEGDLGIYNAIQSAPLDSDSGRREVYSGSSYLQLVGFDEQGPVAQGLLAYSQASEPASAHARDQTELYSRQQWQPLPFTAEQLHAQPPVRRLQLRE